MNAVGQIVTDQFFHTEARMDEGQDYGQRRPLDAAAKDKPVYRDDLTARFLSDGRVGAIYLEVERTSAVAGVYRTVSRLEPTAGAY
jgi:hypothetical protein